MTITVYRASGTLPILVLPFTLSVVDAAIDAVTDDVSYPDVDTEAGPYYETRPDSEESLIQYPVTQQ